MKKNHKGMIVVCAVLAVAFITYFVLNIVFSPYWNSVYAPTGYLSFASMRNAESDGETVTNKQACEDIDYIIKRLNRVHPACIDGVPENVAARAEAEKAAFGETVSQYEMWRACARVLHELGDAHCIAAPSFPYNYLSGYSDLLGNGYELVSVNGASIEDIFRENSGLISYELEPWGMSTVEGLAGTKEGLKYLGIYSDELQYTFASPDGETENLTFTANDFYNLQASGTAEETSDVPYRGEIDKKDNTAILTLESCVYDMDFREFLYEFFLDIRDAGVENLIVDLRGNGGGSSQVLDELLIYLDHDKFIAPGGEWRLGPYMMKWESEEVKVTHLDDVTVFTGELYVLTSHDSFSSSTLIAETLSDNGFAKIVGEPCGNMPEGYGEIVIFQTPNAAVTFQLSTKKFLRIDSSKADQPLIPDIECKGSEALDKALEDIRK